METEIQTAIIAGLSALVGAIIPTVFSYFEKKLDYQKEEKKKWKEIRREEYAKYVEALQNMVNEGEIDNFLPLQASTNRLILFADTELSSLVKKFFNTIVIRTNQSKPLSKDEIEKYETDIINTMRKELDISKEKLTTVSFVKVLSKK